MNASTHFSREDATAQQSCIRKRAYRSESHAKVVAKEARAKSGGAIVAYGCLFCGGWHVGHPRGDGR